MNSTPKSFDEVAMTLATKATADLPNLAKSSYALRVNRVIDHILQHLHTSLDLAHLAQIANFSPFHFHRIFKLLMGETLSDFVRRVRLQRAVQMMSWQGRARLTDIALACGFASSSDFSRSFKQHYSVAPRAFDLKAYRDAQRAAFTPHLGRLSQGSNPDGFALRLTTLPRRVLAYVRVLNPYAPGSGKRELSEMRQWAERHGHSHGQWYGYMWDDPEVVPLAQCRYDLGVEVPRPIRPEGNVSCIEFPPMTVATINLSGSIELELRAIDWFFGTWLPTSGYVPSDQPCFEAFVGLPFAHGDQYFELQLQFPVVRDDLL